MFDLEELRSQVVGLSHADSEAGLVDQVCELERLKAAAAAAQARLVVALDDRRQATARARRALGQDQPARGRRPHPDRGLGAEIGLARRESPHEGRRKLAMARVLVRDMPQTLAALERGDLNERRAEIIATESSDLARDQRRGVDAALAQALGVEGWDGASDAEVREEVRREVLRRDEEGWRARHERARTRRRVTGRHVGDGMGRLSALLPAEEMGQVMQALADGADRLRQQQHQAASNPAAPAPTEPRTRAQLMADLLVSRLGGRPLHTSPTEVHSSPAAPIALKLVVPAETLFADSDEPGYLPGAGYLPAGVVRDLVRHAATQPGSTLQRLFAAPGPGALVALESATTLFRSGLAEFLTLRDRRCRTPWCSAPIRHLDHVVPRAAGGATTAGNGQGLCEACNYTKESPRWRHRGDPTPFSARTVTTTPTAHRHHSRPPRPPGRHLDISVAEASLTRLLVDPAA